MYFGSSIIQLHVRQHQARGLWRIGLNATFDFGTFPLRGKMLKHIDKYFALERLLARQMLLQSFNDDVGPRVPFLD